MSRDYQAVARAIHFLAENTDSQPSLEDVAAITGMSVFRCQRVFSALVGVSPKKFLQYITVGRAKAALDQSASVLDAALEAGLSGPGRLHDLFVSVEAMTPGQYKARGAGLSLRYGVGETPFGTALMLLADAGICGLAFIEPGEEEARLAEMTAPFAAARITRDDAAIAAMLEAIFAAWSGQRPGVQADIRLLLAGTPFQLKVWEALLRIPFGGLATYERIAQAVGNPGASRAVGTAVGANPVGLLIPCHRVIRNTGVIGNYRWGPGRKLLILGAEAALADARAG